MKYVRQVIICLLVLVLTMTFVSAEAGWCDDRWNMARLNAINYAVEDTAGGNCWIEKMYIPPDAELDCESFGKEQSCVFSIVNDYFKPAYRDYEYSEGNFEKGMSDLENNFGVNDPSQYCIPFELTEKRYLYDDDGNAIGYMNPGKWYKCTNIYFPSMPKSTTELSIEENKLDEFHENGLYHCTIGRDTCTGVDWDLWDATPDKDKVGVITQIFHYIFYLDEGSFRTTSRNNKVVLGMNPLWMLVILVGIILLYINRKKLAKIIK